jgi:general secretion pathway protein K
MNQRRERGYAMIAAVAAVAFFGYLSLSAIAGGRSAVVAASAEQARARLAADADAGVAMAIDQLGLTDPARRWSVMGPPRSLDFHGARLTITVEDENGKLPLNFIRADQLKRLFELAGADPRQLESMTDAMLDLRGDPKPRNAAGFLRVDERISAQRGPLTEADELHLLPGMTPELYARIAPAVTVYANTLAFDPRTASPLALAVMNPSVATTPDAIEQARERAGEVAALAARPQFSLDGRIVTVRVDAADGHGGRLRRTAVVQFTGAPSKPYVMRGLE